MNCFEILPNDIINIIADMAKFYKFSHINSTLRNKYKHLFYEHYTLDLDKIDSLNILNIDDVVNIKNITRIHDILYFVGVSLTTLTFGYGFNKPINEVKFPEGCNC